MKKIINYSRLAKVLAFREAKKRVDLITVAASQEMLQDAEDAIELYVRIARACRMEQEAKDSKTLSELTEQLTANLGRRQSSATGS